MISQSWYLLIFLRKTFGFELFFFFLMVFRAETFGFSTADKTADIDEKGIRKEKPEELVMALAEAKVRSQFSITYSC